MVMHLGYTIDANAGVVIGIRGGKIGKQIRSGYIQIQRGQRHWMAHRLIWEATNGPIPEGMEINHINGIKNDNRLANLEVVTRSENARHAYRVGLQRADGIHNGRAIGKRRKMSSEVA